MPDAPAPPELTAEQAAATMASKPYVMLLVIVGVIGVVVSLAAWCFLELVYQITQEVYTHLPHALGYDNGAPLWWPIPVLAIAGVLVALAITRLPGNGGHIPAHGLGGGGGPAQPVDLPGVLLAGLASISLGAVVGPEAPLIALGSGVALLTIRAARRDMAPQVLLIIAAAGSFAAISFIFASPLIAAVLMIEVVGIGGPRLPVVIVPGLLGAGIGTLVSIGMGSFTGLSSSNFALDPVTLPHFAHPTLAQFGWTIALAIAIAVVARIIILGGTRTVPVAARRPLVVLPIIGIIIAGLAIAFHGITDKSINEVLFSGESALSGLVNGAGAWSVGALFALIAFKGIGYSLSIGSFRGGPTFPAVFLGAAAGIAASHLPGFALTPAVAVGMGAGTVAVLRLPLSAVVLATLLTSHAGTGDEPLIIVGVVVAYIVTLVLSAPARATAPEAEPAAPAEAPDVGSPAPAAPA
jgi:chloride channel protein, CIC family